MPPGSAEGPEHHSRLASCIPTILSAAGSECVYVRVSVLSVLLAVAKRNNVQHCSPSCVQHSPVGDCPRDKIE